MRTLVGLALAPEQRCGHGALYGAFSHGRIKTDRPCHALADCPLSRAADSRIVLTVDLSP
ncbi:hypothetical protein [Streptomyces blastmyceticus]|uniref:hypothetical protein n=1 Tax=Streptomyces blastmyceticus TaxID=68180 RepID=UPI0031D223BE